MTWKIERWFAEVFPGRDRIHSEYRELQGRELAIVSAAVLDVALVELLSLRLQDHAKEVESFLGVDGDGRAPAASFGARIQLALLLGILTLEDAAILRTIKDLRNVFAHRARVTFLTPSVLKLTSKLSGLWIARWKSVHGGTSLTALAEMEAYLPQLAEAGQGLLLGVFMTYQAYFHRIYGVIERVDGALSALPDDLDV